MFLVYLESTGTILREVECFREREDCLEAGFNEKYTLRYPKSVGACVLEISEEDYNRLGNDLTKYLVKENTIVENPDWVDPEEDKNKIKSLESQVTDLQMALCDTYESSETQITDLQMAITELYEILLSR